MENDVERNATDEQCSHSLSIQTFGWQGLTISVPGRKSGEKKTILQNCSGFVAAGQLCAILGPSGCGKTTLLSALSGRPTSAHIDSGNVQVNGHNTSNNLLEHVSCLVEQDGSLIGSLTVSEMLQFNARFVARRTRSEEEKTLNRLIRSLGLNDCKDQAIDAVFGKPISAGQRRRVSIGCQLVTEANVIILDEPTSGLDSAASFEVMNYVRQIAKQNNYIVICAIHQPSNTILKLFDQLLLLSGGQTVYYGETSGVVDYFRDTVGVEPVPHIGIAESILSYINFDFSNSENQMRSSVSDLTSHWAESTICRSLMRLLSVALTAQTPIDVNAYKRPRSSGYYRFLVLWERTFLKSRKDISPYWVRFAMYSAFAVVFGTLWFRLEPKQENVQPIVVGIFLATVFMAFMTVAYAPSFIEDYSMYIKDRKNKFYGPATLVLTNFLVSIPYLFLFSLVFSIFVYWTSYFRPSASGFFIWTLLHFLNLLAAESMVVFATSIFPHFVVTLALVSFCNALWVAVAGFSIPITTMNAFYKYVFHYINYLTYVFRGLMENEFAHRSYSCARGCICAYPTDLASRCVFSGQAVLKTYGFEQQKQLQNVVILISIIVSYRLLAYLVLRFR